MKLLKTHDAIAAVQWAFALVLAAGYCVPGQAQAPAWTPPKSGPKSCSKPQWPEKAWFKQAEGTVGLAYRIEADGSVAVAKVAKSSGNEQLDEAARIYLTTCRFIPATLYGKPASSWQTMDFTWEFDRDREDGDDGRVPILVQLGRESRAGNPESMFKLAYRHLDGREVKHDFKLAMRWFRSAAEHGHVKALHVVMGFALNEEGVEFDPAERLAWLQKTAAKGNGEAMLLLGRMYQEGRGVPADPAQAQAWVRKAADAGRPDAYAVLGQMHEAGEGVARDEQEALRLMRIGAQKGSREALFGVARALLSSESAGDHAEGMAALGKIRNSGLAQVYGLMGYAHLHGRGVPVNEVLAADWFFKAAAQNLPYGQFMMAVMLEEGKGVPRNTEEALALYTQAALGGWPAAQRRMVAAAERGELGLAASPEAARGWRAMLEE